MTGAAHHLADNITHFARALRAAGVKVGPDAVLAAIEAVRHLDLGRRADFKIALKATLSTRHEDEAVFEEMFKLFWRTRNLDERLIAILSPEAPPRLGAEKPPPGTRRVQEALAEHAALAADLPARPTIEIDARQTSSRDELLRGEDFAQMSEAELAEARRAVSRLAMPDERVATRRFAPAPRGALDMCRTQARLIWLSPLLGYEHFEPEARGIRALLSHVDEFRPVHSLDAIKALCDALSNTVRPDDGPRNWPASAAA